MRPASLLATVLPHCRGLHLDQVTLAAQQILVEVSSTRRSARCPTCQQRSRRAHSRFIRVLADLPLGSLPCRVHLHARRFRCLNAACPRQTFRERLPDVAPSYQRRTPALHRRLEAVAFALGGQGGRRLLQSLPLATSGISRNAFGIRRDYAAVATALTSPHSQGQTEGQVNRLKMLKRQTYRRAGFDLLWRRVLYHAA